MKNSIYLFIFIIVVPFSCANHKETVVGKQMCINDSGTTSCSLIEKTFTNKGGKVTEYKELYLSCSIQDYFIKICEGNVTLKELEPYINSGITVKMEIREGMWDHCDDNPAYAQSRTGTYVVIKSIIK